MALNSPFRLAYIRLLHQPFDSIIQVLFLAGMELFHRFLKALGLLNLHRHNRH